MRRGGFCHCLLELLGDTGGEWRDEKTEGGLTAHRESLSRDTNRGVRSQPDMQCTRRPLSSETHSGTSNTSSSIIMKLYNRHSSGVDMDIIGVLCVSAIVKFWFLLVLLLSSLFMQFMVGFHNIHYVCMLLSSFNKDTLKTDLLLHFHGL